ncbi:MAG: hypothetical protein RLZZ399_723 [Verrucomicrobiota bacterium]|jgi:lipopolysaccharide export system permease protein
MKVLDRYIGGQLVLTTAVAVGVLSLVLVLGNAFKDLLELLINRSAPPELILTFLSFILPFSMTFSLPWGFLTAVLLVFGRMSAEHELTALRASGVSMTRICLMVFVLAAGCVGVCLWINVDLAPKAQTRNKQILYELLTKRPLAFFDSDKVINEFPGYKIYIGHSEGDQLFNVTVFQLGAETAGGQDPVDVIQAKKGRLILDAPKRLLLLQLENACYAHKKEGADRFEEGITQELGTFPISLEKIYNSHKKRPLSSFTVRELGELYSRSLSGVRLDDLRSPQAATVPSPASPPDPAALAAEQSELRTERSKRFSFALASLAFGLIAIPLAMTTQRKETAVGFFLSLLVAFLYFFLISMVEWVKRKPEWHPEWLMWAPNLVFLTLGVVLFGRLARR